MDMPLCIGGVTLAHRRPRLDELWRQNVDAGGELLSELLGRVGRLGA